MFKFNLLFHFLNTTGRAPVGHCSKPMWPPSESPWKIETREHLDPFLRSESSTQISFMSKDFKDTFRNSSSEIKVSLNECKIKSESLSTVICKPRKSSFQIIYEFHVCLPNPSCPHFRKCRSSNRSVRFLQKHVSDLKRESSTNFEKLTDLALYLHRIQIER